MKKTIEFLRRIKQFFLKLFKREEGTSLRNAERELRLDLGRPQTSRQLGAKQRSQSIFSAYTSWLRRPNKPKEQPHTYDGL